DDQAILNDTWEQFRQYFELPPVVTPAGLQNAIDAAGETVPQAKGSSPDKYVDPTWVQQLDQQGFFKTLQGS
ncbi:MAG TPA: hypothetical protein VFA49_04865, partial [Chloroflexota bacterium]|nr:hypothetical protein [Chloroflexota bacterium]